MENLNWKGWAALIIIALFIVFGGVGSCMYIAPKYNVWKQEMDGKATSAYVQFMTALAFLDPEILAIHSVPWSQLVQALFWLILAGIIRPLREHLRRVFFL